MVSVIIPTYNRGYILRRAVESVLAQTYRDHEVLLVDDGSTDDTRSVAESLAGPKVRYLRHESNRGVAAALNTGVEHARGDLVGFLGSDDVWKPELLELEVPAIENHPSVDGVFGDVEITEGLEGAPWISSVTRLMSAFSRLIPESRATEPIVIEAKQMYLCLLQLEVPIKPTVLLLRRRVFDKLGLFDEHWRSGEDFEFLLRAARASSSFVYVDRPLASQYHLPDATHRVFKEENDMSALALLLDEQRQLRDDVEASAAVRRGISASVRNVCWYYRATGRRWPAFKTYLRGVRATHEPSLLARAALTWVPFGLQARLRREDPAPVA